MYDEGAINRYHELRFVLRTLKLLKAYSATEKRTKRNVKHLRYILTNM